MGSPVVVRAAVSADGPVILGFLEALAMFEKAPGAIRLTEETLARDCFSEPCRFSVLLAEREAAAAGMLIHYQAYSSWQASPSLVIHDLYVDPGHRRHGTGRALLAAAARLARETGCCRIDVNILAWNEGARRFYQRAGFDPLADWQPYRLDRQALNRLAGS